MNSNHQMSQNLVDQLEKSRKERTRKMNKKKSKVYKNEFPETVSLFIVIAIRHSFSYSQD